MRVYYFILYLSGTFEQVTGNGVTDEHPLDWQMRVNREYPGQYVLLNWKEITIEEYNKVKLGR